MRRVLSHPLLWLLLGIVVVVWASTSHARTDGAREVRIAALRDSLKEERKRGDSLESVYHVETVTVRTYRDRWRDSVVTKWDTVSDTILIPVEVVKEVIREGEATIGACTQALQTCDARVENEREQKRLVESERDEWKARASPSLIQQAITTGKWIGFGILIRSLFP